MSKVDCLNEQMPLFELNSMPVFSVQLQRSIILYTTLNESELRFQWLENGNFTTTLQLRAIWKMDGIKRHSQAKLYGYLNEFWWLDSYRTDFEMENAQAHHAMGTLMDDYTRILKWAALDLHIWNGAYENIIAKHLTNTEPTETDISWWGWLIF